MNVSREKKHIVPSSAAVIIIPSRVINISEEKKDQNKFKRVYIKFLTNHRIPMCMKLISNRCRFITNFKNLSKINNSTIQKIQLLLSEVHPKIP